MLAHLQQAITLGLLLLAAVWATWCVSIGAIGWAMGGALLILFGYSLLLALEFVFLWAVHAGDPTPRASAGLLLRAWWQEAGTAPRVFCWRQPFRARAVPDWLPLRAEGEPLGRPGVLLVHGFFCNRAFWNPWLQRLRALDVPCVALDLEPIFGSIDEYGDIIEAAVDRMERATGRTPVIVAHSMGGLAVRAWLARFGADHRVQRIVTIGTPHRGTWLARFGMTRNGLQMRLDSPWHGTLSGLEPASRLARFTCFYSHCDNIVFPPSTATLPGADNRHVPCSAHVHMAFRKEVFDEVLRCVGASADTQGEAPRPQ